jgi:Leucine-rich repeat (LRR) protein
MLDIRIIPLYQLPHQFCEMKQLRTFYFSNIELDSLPDNILNLQQITGIFLDSNKFVIIPWQIGYFPKLAHFSIRYNPLDKLKNGSLSDVKRIDNRSEVQKFQRELRKIFPVPPEYANSLPQFD